MSVSTFTDETSQTALAREIGSRARAEWGDRRPTVLIGRDARMEETLERIARFANADSPVLLTGETGTGKELFARALYLLSARRHRPFLSINCAQYNDGQLVASELFGHKRGSFTGAVADHRGIFEEADGGVVLLDEVGELTPGAQAMLLRVLSEGEVVPVGSGHARHVDVRVIAATSRALAPMIASGAFRADLYYRLRYLHVCVPPVRERGDDWRLIAAHYLRALGNGAVSRKRLSADAERVMRAYHWPGNVRELKSIVDLGYHTSDGDVIEAEHFMQELEGISRQEELRRIPLVREADLLARMTQEHESFWSVVYRPYMDRELSRRDVRALIDAGLARTRGSYKKLLELFGVEADDYLKFMDFLRHQKLKPDMDA